MTSRVATVEHRTAQEEEHRWVLLFHVLFAATLLVPSALVLAERPDGSGATLALAASLAAWYVLLFSRQGPGGSRRVLLLYAAGAGILYTALVVREPSFVLVLYALLPQFFSSLRRWEAVAGIAAVVVVPALLTGGLDLGDWFSLATSIALGLVITAIIEMLGRRNDEQREIIAALEAARAENARLTEEAAVQGRAAGVLAERQRLAHDIHDTLAQSFTSVVAQLEAAEQALATPGIEHVAAAATHVARAKTTARTGLAEARRTVQALRPAPLEGADLPEALALLVDRWQQERGDRTEVAIVVDGPTRTLPDEVEDALLRVAQQALANAARHAEAEHVTITVSYLGAVLHLDVQDDGTGLRPRETPGDRRGFGMTSMRERMELVGGELTVESTPGEGTTVAASVPLPDRGGLVPGRAPAAGGGTEAREATRDR